MPNPPMPTIPPPLAAHERREFLWFMLFALVLLGVGIGLRDPWPSDEPRFVLVARDMVVTGQWLLPRVGGQPYADKPPLFFWLIAVCLEVTRSLRIAFLLPSFFAGLGCVGLVYDLGRRFWKRDTGLAAGLALLFTVQFVWQARQAQIDVLLHFFPFGQRDDVFVSVFKTPRAHADVGGELAIF
jgi:4-amino-4-deoxy-L-arabinose transferase-like glycosyltransferase